MSQYRYSSLALALFAVLTGAAHAQSLSELFESARGYDATYLSAHLQHDADVAKADQARALLLPSVGLSASVTRSALDYSTPHISYPFGSQGVTLNASQPLYRPQNQASFSQGRKQLELSQAQLIAAEQDLIVRVSQAYFDALSAKDNLDFVAAHKTAVAEQLASAKRNFEVGTTTITDQRDAQASYDLVLAQEIAATNDLRIKLLALDQLVGKVSTQPKSLQVPVLLPALAPDDQNVWVQQAQELHPSIQLAQLALDVAKLETEKAQAGHKPTVDLVGSYGVSNNDGGSSTGPGSSRGKVASVGVQFNLPLFAGFSIQNRVRETIALEDKARSDLEGAKRAVTQATLTAYYGVMSGVSQVKAYEAAEASSQSALDANKLGYQVGVRINIDVLNSQSQLFDTKAKLAKARYDVLLGGLKLRQANGTLKADDLNAINVLLTQ
jgi:outer membrane protein